MPGRQGAEKGEKKGEGGGEIAVWQPAGRGDVITRLTGGISPRDGGRRETQEAREEQADFSG